MQGLLTCATRAREGFESLIGTKKIVLAFHIFGTFLSVLSKMMMQNGQILVVFRGCGPWLTSRTPIPILNLMSFKLQVAVYSFFRTKSRGIMLMKPRKKRGP